MLTIEQIIEIAKENGASIDYNSETYGIGYTNLNGNFETCTPFEKIYLDDNYEYFENNSIAYVAAWLRRSNMQLSENTNSILKFKGLYYKEISFNRTEKKDIKTEIYFDKQTTIISDEDCEVELILNLKHTDFDIKISLNGSFSIICGDPDMKKQIIEKNTVSILFPYIRSEVTILTTQPGLEPIIIPPLNINRLIDELNGEHWCVG